MGFGKKILKHLGVGSSSSSSSRREPHHLYYDTHDTVSAASVTVNNDERDISTDRSNGTYVRLARLSNGIILAAFTWREGGRMDSLRILKISRSLDGGQTFTDFSEIVRGHGEIDNPHILEIASDGDGQHILAAFRNHDFGPGRAGDLAGITHFRITVFESRDAGASWHYLSEAAEKTDGFPLGIWEPFMRMGLQGEVQLIYSHEFAPDDQRTMMVQSFDRGRTWSQPRCIEGAQENRFRDGMTGITETVDTATGQVALVMIFETTRYAPHFNIEAVVSYDDGMTWLHRHQVFTPRRRAHNAGAPQITSFGDGSMAAVFMTDEDAEDVAWVQNAAIKICFGSAPHNGIIRWSEPLTVSPASSFWPSIMAIDARTALVTYEHGGPRVRSVVRS